MQLTLISKSENVAWHDNDSLLYTGHKCFEMGTLSIKLSTWLSKANPREKFQRNLKFLHRSDWLCYATGWLLGELRITVIKIAGYGIKIAMGCKFLWKILHSTGTRSCLAARSLVKFQCAVLCPFNNWCFFGSVKKTKIQIRKYKSAQKKLLGNTGSCEIPIEFRAASSFIWHLIDNNTLIWSSSWFITRLKKRKILIHKYMYFQIDFYSIVHGTELQSTSISCQNSILCLQFDVWLLYIVWISKY